MSFHNLQLEHKCSRPLKQQNIMKNGVKQVAYYIFHFTYIVFGSCAHLVMTLKLYLCTK